jgi:hypothetical protein
MPTTPLVTPGTSAIAERLAPGNHQELKGRNIRPLTTAGTQATAGKKATAGPPTLYGRYQKQGSLQKQ